MRTFTRAVDPPPALSLPASARRERLRYHVAFLLLGVAVLAAVAPLSLTDSGRVALGVIALPPVCAFRSLTGIDCPGCGLTRCFVAAAHGRIAEAWRFHTTGLLLAALVLGQIPYRTLQLWRLARGKTEWRHRAISWIPWLALVSLIGEWLARRIALSV